MPLSVMECRNRSIEKTLYEICRLANHSSVNKNRGGGLAGAVDLASGVVALIVRLNRLADRSVQPPDQKMNLSDSEMLRPGLGTHAL